MTEYDEILPKQATKGTTLSIGVAKRRIAYTFVPFDESAYLEQLKPNDDEVIVLEMKDRGSGEYIIIELYKADTYFEENRVDVIPSPDKWSPEHLKLVVDSRYYWIVTRRAGFNVRLWIATAITIAELFGGLIDTSLPSLDHLNLPMNAGQLRGLTGQLLTNELRE